MSAPPGAPLGPVNAYVKVGSRPLPWTQILTGVVPDVGRAIASGEPCMPQLPLVRNPIKSTLIGDDAAAVVGSTTTMFFPSASGVPELSEIVSSETSNGTITNGTGLESAAGVPGFCT